LLLEERISRVLVEGAAAAEKGFIVGEADQRVSRATFSDAVPVTDVVPVTVCEP
jgi:hypothetical protein